MGIMEKKMETTIMGYAGLHKLCLELLTTSQMFEDGPCVDNLLKLSLGILYTLSLGFRARVLSPNP